MRTKFRATLMAGAALCAVGTAAHAQPGAAPAAPVPVQTRAGASISQPSRSGLEEVVVTAQRRSTRLQRTPVAVTSLDARALEQKGVSSLLDLGGAVPNLTVSSRSTTGAASGGFTIRGIGTDATGSSPSVGIYIDEVYYPSQFGNLIGLFDVSRIEVLRGPQGTLFGRNTIAGAVNYVGNKPSNTFGGYVESTLGSYDRREVDGALNIPVTDKLSVRVAGEYNNAGGYVHDQLANVDRGAETTSFGKVQAHWTPTDTLTFDLRGDVLHDSENGRAIAILAGPSGQGPNPTALFPSLASQLGVSLAGYGPGLISKPGGYAFAGFGSPDFLAYDYHGVSLVSAWNVNDDLTLKSITAYSYDRYAVDQDLSDSPYAIFNASRSKIADSLFNEEVQATGHVLGDRITYTVGGYYYDNTNPSIGQNTTFGGQGQGLFPNGFLATENGGDYQLHDVAKALYGQTQILLVPHVHLIAGLRYSEETIDGSYLNTTVATPPLVVGFSNGAPILENHLVTTGQPAFPSKSLSFSNLSPTFGLDYQATSDILLYAKASRGFRAGGFSVSSSYPGAFQEFGPEEAWTYEAGARGEFFDHRLRLNPTIFRTDWTGIQFNTFEAISNGLVPITRNAGHAEISGFELESVVEPVPKLLLNGSFSWLYGRYDRIGQGVDVFPGTPLEHSPKFKFDIGASYSADFGKYGGLVGNIDYNWTAKQSSAVTIGDAIEEPAFGLLNAQLECTPAYQPPYGRWSIAAYGLNLTNKYYYIGGVNGGISYISPGVINSTGTFGTTEADLGRPREVGVRLRYRF